MQIRRILTRQLQLYAVAATLIVAAPVAALAASPETEGSAYQNTRYLEDFSYLSDSSRSTDFWDGVKYIRLGDDPYGLGDPYLSFGGELRERFETYSNPNFAIKAPAHDAYLLQRAMLHADLHLNDYVRGFLQLFSMQRLGVRGVPSTTDIDQLDVSQAFIDLRAPTPLGDEPTLRSGRQEVLFGYQRLVSVREGPNVRRSFDGFRLSDAWNGATLDVVALRPVQDEIGAFNDYSNMNQSLWGTYATVPVWGGLKADLYWLGYENDHATYLGKTGEERRQSFGTRLFGTARGWDWNEEAVLQFGSFRDQDIRAWMLASAVGYTFSDIPWLPRLGFERNASSGDHPGSGSLGTYNGLFPRLPYFAETALLVPSNIHDVPAGPEGPSAARCFCGGGVGYAVAHLHAGCVVWQRDGGVSRNGEGDLRTGGHRGVARHPLAARSAFVIRRHLCALPGRAGADGSPRQNRRLWCDVRNIQVLNSGIAGSRGALERPGAVGHAGGMQRPQPAQAEVTCSQVLPAALEVQGVSHAYGARMALDNVSLTVPQARFTVLLGLNGAGKTTLFSLITRLFHTRQGSIRVLGHRVDQAPGEALRQLGVVFQARTLDLDLSVRENLLYHAALHGIGGRAARRQADAALQEVELAGRAGDPARRLSGGQMRRVEIARALMHRPRLLVLDEPTVGLDVAARAAILRHVRGLVRERGVAVLWATHLLDEIAADDLIVVLHKGRVLAAGETGDVVAQSGAAGIHDAFSRLTGEEREKT